MGAIIRRQMRRGFRIRLICRRFAQKASQTRENEKSRETRRKTGLILRNKSSSQAAGKSSNQEADYWRGIDTDSGNVIDCRLTEMGAAFVVGGMCRFNARDLRPVCALA